MRVTGDLEIRPGPGIPSGLTIPAAELVERFSRSSGPGGQSVNTTDSRVELEYDVAASQALTEPQRHRILTRMARRLVDERLLVVVASEHRSQHRNRAAARERLGVLIRIAVTPPSPPRRPTKPSATARRRRVEAKRQRGQTKALRGRLRGDPG